MTTIMNQPWFKLACYLGTLVFFEFVSKSTDISTDDIIKYTWWDWMKFAAGMLAPAMLVVRTYTDGSFQKHVEEKKEQKEQEIKVIEVQKQ